MDIDNAVDLAPAEAGAVSASVPDWEREDRRPGVTEPGRLLIASIRSYQRHAASSGPFARIAKAAAVLRHRYWTVITGADIPLNCDLGGGLVLPHPNGIVIHPRSTIGPNCMIFQQVTIGEGAREGLPRIGGHVDIGAGAKILGGVTIGDHAKIGANAVVLQDVPDGASAVGVPARIVRAEATRQ